jgi:hypothetical protein
MSTYDALRNTFLNARSGKCLAYRSLKCFAWLIDVPVDTQFSDINIRTGQFDKAVTKYIAKVVITTPGSSRNMSTQYRDPITHTNHDKSSETIPNLIEEANTQQIAWMRTLSKGLYVECPSVASICFFDNQNGTKFVQYLRSKFGSPDLDNPLDNDKKRANYVCEYLLDRLKVIPSNTSNSIRGISVILMPLVGYEEKDVKIETLGDFLRLTDNSVLGKGIINQYSKDSAFSLVTASVIRLFFAGIIHMDLHSDNSLIYFTQDKRGNIRIQSKLLDFGNSTIFTDIYKSNKFLFSRQNQDLSNLRDSLSKQPDFFFRFDDNQNNIPDKVNLVGDLIERIQIADRTGNAREFNLQQSQMGNWWNYVRDMTDIPRRTKIIVEAYNIARRGYDCDIAPDNIARRGVYLDIAIDYQVQHKLQGDGVPIFDPQPTFSSWDVDINDGRVRPDQPPPPPSDISTRSASRRKNAEINTYNRGNTDAYTAPVPQQAQGWFTRRNMAIGAIGATILGYSIYRYLKNCSGENEIGDYDGSIMNGGQAITIETIKDYVNSNNLQDMLVEMIKTDSCPIGDNKIHSQKIFEMMNMLPEDQRESVTLGELIEESYIKEHQEAGRRRRSKKQRTKKQRKTRKSRTKKQRKTKRR